MTILYGISTLVMTIFSVNCAYSQSPVDRSKNEKFTTILSYYQNKHENEKAEAAKFLVDNISIHFSEDIVWIDNSYKRVEFNELNYGDIEEAFEMHKRLHDSIGLSSQKITISDKDVLKTDYLIKNIDDAYKVYKEKKWSKNYSFSIFCEYILPYRSLTEPLGNWRTEYMQTFEKSLVKLEDDSDPVEVCSKILSSIQHFDFVMKRFNPKPLLGPNELLFWRQGNCPDLANVALFACRSLGIAVTFDYTPHFAASSNRHYWNTVIDKKGNHIPFNGNQELPFAYNPLSKRLGKVFRVTFSKQIDNLPSIIPENEILDETFKSQNIIDVTHEYVEVSDVKYLINETQNRIAYINVFNKGQWRPLYWSKVDSGTAIFKNMGRDIVYIISSGKPNNVKFERYPLLIDIQGGQKILKPDFEKTFSMTISRKNEVKTQYTDYNTLQILKGERYMLYAWNGKWQLVEETNAIEDDQIEFKKIPTNSLLLLCPQRPDFFERVFTLNANNGQITWY